MSDTPTPSNTPIATIRHVVRSILFLAARTSRYFRKQMLRCSWRKNSTEIDTPEPADPYWIDFSIVCYGAYRYWYSVSSKQRMPLRSGFIITRLTAASTSGSTCLSETHSGLDALRDTDDQPPSATWRTGLGLFSGRWFDVGYYRHMIFGGSLIYFFPLYPLPFLSMHLRWFLVVDHERQALPSLPSVSTWTRFRDRFPFCAMFVCSSYGSRFHHLY